MRIALCGPSNSSRIFIGVNFISSRNYVIVLDRNDGPCPVVLKMPRIQYACSFRTYLCRNADIYGSLYRFIKACTAIHAMFDDVKKSNASFS